MPVLTDELIRKLPKTDLHVHLDGSLRIPTLIELAKRHHITLPSYTVEGLRELVFKETYKNLPEYLEGFQYTTAVMCDAEAIERIAYEFCLDNQAEGVRYVEVRFAPQLSVRDDFTMTEVVKAVTRKNYYVAEVVRPKNAHLRACLSGALRGHAHTGRRPVDAQSRSQLRELTLRRARRIRAGFPLVRSAGTYELTRGTPPTWPARHASAAAREVELAPGFVDNDGRGVREIEAAVAGDHW